MAGTTRRFDMEQTSKRGDPGQRQKQRGRARGMTWCTEGATVAVLGWTAAGRIMGGGE